MRNLADNLLALNGIYRTLEDVLTVYCLFTMNYTTAYLNLHKLRQIAITLYIILLTISSNFEERI